MHQIFSALIQLLGYSVVVLSSFQKIPQLVKVLKAGKADSISIASIQFDILAYSIGASYGYMHHLSIFVYGESIVLLAQTITLFFLVAWYTELLSSTKIQLVIGLYIMWGSCVVMQWLPENILSLQLLLNIPIIASGKSSQILKLYRTKKSGQVSFYMYAIAAYGAVIRIITTIVEVGNFTILFIYLLTTVLNLVIMMLIMRYKEN